MSFGRWLLIHSFSIFLLVLLFLGYIYRSELQLEQAYHQLLNIDPKNVTLTPQQATQPAAVDVRDKAIESNKEPEKKPGPSKPAVDSPRQALVQPLASVPTISTLPTKPGNAQQLQSKEDRLLLARKAYWNKNYADAIRLYQQLIQQDRYNPDYLGELGNIYYSLNDTQNASRLYYQAALIFIDQNQPERAGLLVSPILAMDRELGDKLNSKLQ